MEELIRKAYNNLALSEGKRVEEEVVQMITGLNNGLNQLEGEQKDRAQELLEVTIPIHGAMSNAKDFEAMKLLVMANIQTLYSHLV
jgi:hypothetical protein